MWNSHLHYNLLQQGAGKYEEGEESEVSCQKKELINEYEGNGDSENVARVKAENDLLSVYNLKIQKDMIGWNWQN